MIDIERIDADITLKDTVVYRAYNILNAQLGSLFFSTGLGIDLNFFLGQNFTIQTEVFFNYIQQVLVDNRITISDVKTVIQDFRTKFEFQLKESNSNQLIGG